jgi:triphosphatase
MSTDQQEIEWQFDAVDIDAVERWLLEHTAREGVTASQSDTIELVDAYFDTADWRIYNAGYALRVRCQFTKEKNPQISRAEATLKSLTPAVKGIRRRRELSEDLASGGLCSERQTLQMLRKAAGEVGRRAHALCGTHAIVQLFEAHTTRRTFSLCVDGAAAGEAVLDETRILSAGRGKDLEMLRVEVEVKASPATDLKSATKALKMFVKQMRKACKLQPAEQSKYECGLALRNLIPATAADADYGPTHIDRSSTMGEMAFAVMRRYLTDFLSHEPGVRLGDDLDEVHLMRVATRRLRAAMNLFKDVLPERVATLRDELGQVAAALGAVRDLDVQIERVNGWIAGEAPDAAAGAVAAQGTQPAALKKVVALLVEQRADAHRQLVEAMDSRRYEQFIADFAKLLRRPPATPAAVKQAASTKALDVMPGLIKQRYRKVIKLGSQLGPDSSPADYHSVRIEGKRLRYSLEFVSKLYAKPAKKMMARAVDLQDTLGLFQDAQVAMGRLQAMRTDPAHKLSPDDLVSCEVALQRYQRIAEEVKAEFPVVYGALKGKPWKRLQKVLKKRT